MFGWSKPTCTLDTLTRRWLEERWRWLKDQFGVDVVLDAPHVLPTPEYFPDQYDGGDDAVLVMTRRVCQYMSVPEDLVDFRFFSAENRPFLVNEHGKAVGGTAGTFEDGVRYTIRIERLQAREPMTMVGTEMSATKPAADSLVTARPAITLPSSAMPLCARPSKASNGCPTMRDTRPRHIGNERL